MIAVVDASTILMVLLSDEGDAAADRMAQGQLAAPHLLGFEVANVIRRRWSSQLLSQGQAELALDGFAKLEIDFWPHALLAQQMWQLRGQLSAYDAAYVALAKLLGAPLLTADARLAKACQQAESGIAVEVL
jgi:predicted nucleic acid-binding protein